MASAQEIISAIEGVVTAFQYSSWTIGVTDLPPDRRSQHGHPAEWYDWNANTEEIARGVEAYFIGKGMKGGVGGPGRADYVYIFQ